LNTEQRSRSSYPPPELPAGEARHAAAATRCQSSSPEKHAVPQQLPAAGEAHRTAAATHRQSTSSRPLPDSI